MGIITIKGLRMQAYHGVLPQEQKVGNMFEVDIELDVPKSNTAAETDNLVDTLNYAEIVAIVKEVMAQRSNLIEHVAKRIADAIEDRFPYITESGKVTIKKLAPPIPAELDYVAFTYSW